MPEREMILSMVQASAVCNKLIKREIRFISIKQNLDIKGAKLQDGTHLCFFSEQRCLAFELFSFRPCEDFDRAILAVVARRYADVTGAHARYGLTDKH